MSEVIQAPKSITTDRTGGRTGTGFECEDIGFYYVVGEGEEKKGEWSYLAAQSASLWPGSGQEPLRLLATALSSFQERFEVLSHFVAKLAETLIPVSDPRRIELYKVMEAYSRPYLSPKSDATGGVLEGLRLEHDELLSYERNESPEVARAFLGVVRTLPAESAERRDIYTDEELE